MSAIPGRVPGVYNYKMFYHVTALNISIQGLYSGAMLSVRQLKLSLRD